eukprot:15477197-Alexandrium_andersonii.AAC.1
MPARVPSKGGGGGSIWRVGTTPCTLAQWRRARARNCCSFLGAGSSTAQEQRGHCHAVPCPSRGTPTPHKRWAR